MGRRSYKGLFKPRNPHKYKGDLENIVWRSSWELKLMNQLDKSKSVLEWSSEPFAIKYISPVDNRMHRYFPDFYVYSISKNGKRTKCLIEVKPAHETRPPKPGKRKSKRFLTEQKTYHVNQAKWDAARKFCNKVGWDFRVATEYQLGIK